MLCAGDDSFEVKENGSSDPTGPNVIPVLLAKENLPGRLELFAICKNRKKKEIYKESPIPISQCVQ